MKEYGAIETATKAETRCSVRERLNKLEEMMHETNDTLMNIVSQIDGTPKTEEELTDNNYMDESLDCIDRLAYDCVCMTKKIQKLLFG